MESKYYSIEYDVIIENVVTRIRAYGSGIEIYPSRFKYIDMYSGSKIEYWFPKDKHSNQLADDIKNIKINTI